MGVGADPAGVDTSGRIHQAPDDRTAQPEPGEDPCVPDRHRYPPDPLTSKKRTYKRGISRGEHHHDRAGSRVIAEGASEKPNASTAKTQASGDNKQLMGPWGDRVLPARNSRCAMLKLSLEDHKQLPGPNLA
ncbi:MAG: hypothetical protein AB7V46_23710 [Thermomicrobiales bacterium]